MKTSPKVAPARQASFQVLCRIESLKSFSDYALYSRALARLEPLDRNLSTEIVLGTLRWQAALDFLLAAAVSRPLEEIDSKVRILLRMSIYQMWRLDRIPDHALVHDAVELCKQELRSGTDKFVNAVLRRVSREPPWKQPGFAERCPIWDLVSLPRWLWERWEQRFGFERAREYALSLNVPPRLSFRSSTGSTDETVETFESIGTVERSGLVPGAFLLNSGANLSGQKVSQSRFSVQDEASQLIPFLFGSLKGYVWDVCAAPGGKGAILRRLCGDDGWVVSTELHFHRARRLRDFLARGSGARSDVLVADASMHPPFRCSFSAVLVDAPCSGLGTLRRNPEIKWRARPEHPGSFQALQLKLLASSAGFVRAGGSLLYSTCSTEPEENEEVVKSFLAMHSDFQLVRPSSPSGVESWLGTDSMLRTFPSAHLWDGFFAALMVRKP